VSLPNCSTPLPANMAYIGDHRPTSSTIGVASLFFPGHLIEVSFVIDTRLPAPPQARHA
jgi:2-iminobutanoate/2-iminopropanoate deaminase